MEETELAPAASTGPSPEHIRQVFRRYGELMSHGDAAAVAALFAPDAVLRDPIDAPPRHGLEAIRAFYQEGFDSSGGGFEMALEGDVRVVGRYGAAAYVVRNDRQGEPYRVDTLDVMRFDDEGRIISLEAYWGPTNFHAAVSEDAT